MEKSIYCTVRWSNHSNNVNRFLSVNYAEEKYTDVAIACDGHVLKAHKMILAGCSPYFENLFSMYNVTNLCVTVEGIAYPILQLVLEFMYSGEIRVKHSELENLVKAGVQLKVKGLDAIKLNDLSRGGERTTVIARPTDGNTNQKVTKSSRPVPMQIPKSPQKPSDSIPPSSMRSPTRKTEPLNVQQERLKPMQKSLNFYSQNPSSTSTPLPKIKQDPIKEPLENSKPSDSPNKKKSQLMANSNEFEKEKSTASNNPSKPGTLTSESKRKVGEWLDSLEHTEKKQQSEESKPEPQPKQTRKRVTKPRAVRTVSEAKVSRALKRLRSANAVEGDKNPVEEPPLTAQGKEDESDPTSLCDKSLSPLEVSPIKTVSEVETTDKEEIQVDTLPRLKEEVASAKDSEEANQDEMLDATPKTPKKNISEKVEVTTTRSRTIKKPARMADAEFEFETEVGHTKKRRSRKIEEVEAESVGEESAPDGKSSPVKKRKANPFMLFSNEFRAKLMEDYPGESSKDISKRLGLLWQNLDQASKEKYQDPESRSK